MIKFEENEVEKEKIGFYIKILILIFYFFLFIFSFKNLKQDNKIVYIKKYIYENSSCSHNYYQRKKFEPTEKNEGKIIFLCGLCGNQYIETLPKLDKKNYIIKRLIANMEMGKDIY
jgi:hypothetical protein